jgi:hypothetical protein
MHLRLSRQVFSLLLRWKVFCPQATNSQNKLAKITTNFQTKPNSVVLEGLPADNLSKVICKIRETRPILTEATVGKRFSVNKKRETSVKYTVLL